MSNYPILLDDDTTLPIVNDNLTEIGGDAINALRDATFSIEQTLGTNIAGTMPSLAARLGVFIGPNGMPIPSVLNSLGLVTLPITQDQIITNAGIPESKLHLDIPTQNLFNYIRDLSRDVNSALGWISISGVKLEAHLIGMTYRHDLHQIDVGTSSVQFLNNKFRTLRDNTSAYTAINDVNNELLSHQWADGSPFGTILNVTTNNGSTYPSNYSHLASGIFLQSSVFSSLPQTIQDVQSFAQYIDTASIFLYGTRIQNFYSNGISRNSRSSVLTADGYGQAIVPITAATAFLSNLGSPLDDIDTGDDIIKFTPSSTVINNNSFDEQFALVKIGDIIRINYGTIEVGYVIKEKKYNQQPGSKQYIVRIAGKNLFSTTTATARIDRPLYNNNKYGVLAVAPANDPFSNSIIPSLIVGSPRGAQALGLGFNAAQFDTTHYLLYLALYTTGNPLDGYTIMPGIDVTGNAGITPGAYTLDSIVQTTNNAFRQAGFNYRFIAFSYQGNFGIMLADSYNNSAFSIISAVVASNGTYDVVNTAINFGNNVVGVISPAAPGTAPDPLGFGPLNANIASPPFLTSYGSVAAAALPTRLFVPLKRNTYYVNGTEREKLNLEVGQVLDTFGDGYWVATIDGYNVVPNSRVEMTYKVPLDLSTSNLKVGKTLVVQHLGSGSTLVDAGRFIIKSIAVECSPSSDTKITVWDAVHATGASPFAVAPVGTTVALYFSSDSVTLNSENSSDILSVNPFKRHFEVYVDQNASTYTHERGRIYTGSNPGTVNTVPIYTDTNLSHINFMKISPKLRGYQFGSVNKITLLMQAYTLATGEYDGYLCNYNAGTAINCGPLTFGKRGEITRFYDESNVDYIDLVFDLNISEVIGSVASATPIDVQLFPTLSLDKEIMLASTCQHNTTNNTVDHFIDQRQFGNISEEELSTSALAFLSAPQRLLQGNGVIRGFDLETLGFGTNPNSGQIFLTGGQALVNGNLVQINADTVNIPLVKELYSGNYYNINWVLCVNSQGEYQPIVLLDFDSTLTTPNAPHRLVQLFNILSGTIYLADATTFSDLINNRKDLAPLYIVASTVTTPANTISLTLADARKYIVDGDTNLSLKLTSAKAQGNFHSPAAILNWLKYNSGFNGTAIVKGATNITGVISTDITLGSCSIDGQGNAILTMNGKVTLGSNLILQNLNIIFNGGINVTPGASNISFINCDVTINNPASGTLAGNNITFNFLNSDNIRFDNTDFTVAYTNAAGIGFTAGALFYLTNTTNFVFNNSDVLNLTYSVAQGVTVPGDVFIIRNSPGIIITNSTFSGNYNQFFRNTNSNNFLLQNLTVSSTYTPYNGIGSPDVYNITTDPLGSLDSLPNVAYNINFPPLNGDVVNTGRGYIYANVVGSLDNGNIDNVIFIDGYASPGAGYHRFSYINFELSQSTSVLSNISVINCTFRSLNTGGRVEDFRPAVAIVNTCGVGIPLGSQPILQNIFIENNYCNRAQTIIITSKTDSTGKMVYPGLSTQNVFISNNTCGTIGYWVSAGTKIINTPPNANALSDKTSGLVIANNVCHYIASLDHQGKYFLVSRIVGNISTNMCAYPSGNVIIKNNSTNWIHTGIAFEESSSLDIISNNLTAYDINYIVSYHGDGYVRPDGYANAVFDPRGIVPSASGISTGYAIFVGANKKTLPISLTPGEGNDSSVRIAGNTTSTGYWIETTSFPFTYNYFFGYAYCQASCTIDSNTFKGVADGYGQLVLCGGLNSRVTNNNIYRNGHVIFSYVGFGNFDSISPGTIAWNGLESTGIVTGNYFDSPFTDNTTINFNNNLFTEATIKIAFINTSVFNWAAHTNKNQTGYLNIPITEQLVPYGGLGYVQNNPVGSPANAPFDTGYKLTQAPTVGVLSNPGKYLGTGLYRSLVLRLHDADAAITRNLGWQQTLDKFIPQGARLVLMQMGVKPFGSIVTTSAPDSVIIMTLNKYPLANAYINLDYMSVAGDPGVGSADFALLNSFLPPLNTSIMSAIVDGFEINSTTNTLYASIDTIAMPQVSGGTLDVSNLFVSGGDTAFGVSIDITYQRNGVTTELYFSPIYVKYRW